MSVVLFILELFIITNILFVVLFFGTAGEEILKRGDRYKDIVN